MVGVVSTSESNDNLYRELSQKNRFLQRTEHGFQCANSQSVPDKKPGFIKKAWYVLLIQPSGSV